MKKFLVCLFFGVVAGYTARGVVNMRDIQTTLDALLFTITIHGQDVGERLMILSHMLVSEHRGDIWINMFYLFAYGALEEFLKLGAIVLAVALLKPASMRSFVFLGACIGVGFALSEHRYFDTLQFQNSYISFLIKVLGHSLFTGVVALWYAWGMFARMRWIDTGAYQKFRGFLMRYGSQGIMIAWLFTGFVIATCLHIMLNIFTATGAYPIVVVIIMSFWMILILYLSTRASERPYGRILYEIRLMRDIYENQKLLSGLHSTDDGPAPKKEHSHFSTQKIRTSRKQFAKK